MENQPNSFITNLEKLISRCQDPNIMKPLTFTSYDGNQTFYFSRKEYDQNR